MMFLILATFLASVDGELKQDDFTSCSNLFPFMSQECWVQVMIKSLGLLIILCACLSKAPVLMNMFQNKSSTGISRGATYGDVLSKQAYLILNIVVIFYIHITNRNSIVLVVLPFLWLRYVRWYF